MKLTLEIWRQKGARAPGGFITYRVDDVSPDMSFLEMLDVLNESLIAQGEEPVAFDHDCRDAVRRREGVAARAPAAGPSRARDPRPRHGRAHGRGGLRRLHESLRVHGRLPEGHLRGFHRAPERGIPHGRARRRPPPVRIVLLLVLYALVL